MDAKTQRQIVPCSICGTLVSRNVRLANPRKIYCSIDCKALSQTMHRPIGKDDLRRLYVDEGQTAVDIGRMVGRDPKSVWNWLKWDGVPTNPRGADIRQHFKNGHKICVGRVMSEASKDKIRQARIADGSKCLFKPNGDHVLKGVRGAAHPSWQGGGTPLRQAFYASDEWKAACVAVWRRADAKCERCGMDHRAIDRTKFAFHVHHVSGFLKYPEMRAQPNNLKLLCQTCHKWVHGKLNINREMIIK